MIFINYRRKDAAGTTGRIYDHLEQSFHPDELFMDVEDIPAGLDFVRRLEGEVHRCDVFLAIIGPDWLSLSDAAGRRLIERDNDFVRIEIEAALKQNKYVIPVLVEGADMPSAADLPASIRPLARRSALRVVHERFRSDIQRMVGLLRRAQAEARAAQDATLQITPDQLPNASSRQRPVRRPRFRIDAHDTVIDRVSSAEPTEMMLDRSWASPDKASSGVDRPSAPKTDPSSGDEGA